MTTEPDNERLVLLAQIALEGVRMTPEAQEIATMERLRLILKAAQSRARQGMPQRSYVAAGEGVAFTDDELFI